MINGLCNTCFDFYCYSRGQTKSSSKGKKEEIVIANGEREFDQDVISIDLHLKEEYNQVVEAF